LDLFNRGLVQQSDVLTAFARNGIPEFWWNPLFDTARSLLSPADLALAVLRGELDQLDAQAYAATTGLSSADFDTLIANTGEPPGAEQMMQALRRDFVDVDTFTRAILQSRIRDEWIPTMLKLQFSPMSFQDAAKLVVENYLTMDEGAAIAKANGLEPDHWPLVVKGWGRPLSHEQMMALYFRGEATIDEVRAAFLQSDLKDEYIDQAIQLGRRLVPERMIVEMIDHAVVDHATGEAMLMAQGYNQADADALIKLGGAQRLATAKNLSRGDITSMYEDNLLSRDSAEAHLVSLGWSKNDADAILSLADVKSQATAMRKLQAQIEASIRGGDLTRQQALSELEGAGLDSATATGLVDKWLAVASKPSRGLTEAQIIKGARSGVIESLDAARRLVGLGLSTDDATLLLLIEGVKVSSFGPQTGTV
jgi:hypothetical protein